VETKENRIRHHPNFNPSKVLPVLSVKMIGNKKRGAKGEEELRRTFLVHGDQISIQESKIQWRRYRGKMKLS
jgi:hypothetical protein